jgi:hypothetical protein
MFGCAGHAALTGATRIFMGKLLVKFHLKDQNGYGWIILKSILWV